jgi:hypothetical protein
MHRLIFRRNDARIFCSQGQFQFRAGHAQAKSKDIRVAGQLWSSSIVTLFLPGSPDGLK